MQIVIFTHPSFLPSKSMPKYANLLSQGLQKRGHKVELYTAKAVLYNLPFPIFTKKWLGYVDQFLIFPLKIRKFITKKPKETLFVFADQALGPWIPFLTKKPHIIHCHDFLAQRSALGEIKENPVGITGKIYQTFIRNGYRKGKNFISISNKTQSDLHFFLGRTPTISEVVYNGFNQEFSTGCFTEARQQLEKEFGIKLDNGFILHVGGNQFYKNRKGVIEIYSAWRTMSKTPLPLVMIGSSPTQKLLDHSLKSEFSSDIHFRISVSDQLLQLAYRGATLLLYPSLEEGFGWPIAEAMACGCPVVTTGKAPMNEVGGEHSFYIPPCPEEGSLRHWWGNESAIIMNRVCELSAINRKEIVAWGLKNAQRFNTEKSVEKIEAIYQRVLTTS